MFEVFFYSKIVIYVTMVTWFNEESKKRFFAVREVHFIFSLSA
jgi:hypothetical protein